MNSHLASTARAIWLLISLAMVGAWIMGLCGARWRWERSRVEVGIGRLAALEIDYSTGYPEPVDQWSRSLVLNEQEHFWLGVWFESREWQVGWHPRQALVAGTTWSQRLPMSSVHSLTVRIPLLWGLTV